MAERRIAAHRDHVVLTSGHTFNEERVANSDEVHYLRPYPVEHFEHAVAPGEPIAVAGMGLVGYDLITALTIGRGGTYKDDGDRERTMCRAVVNPNLPLLTLRSPVLREVGSRR